MGGGQDVDRVADGRGGDSTRVTKRAQVARDYKLDLKGGDRMIDDGMMECYQASARFCAMVICTANVLCFPYLVPVRCAHTIMHTGVFVQRTSCAFPFGSKYSTTPCMLVSSPLSDRNANAAMPNWRVS